MARLVFIFFKSEGMSLKTYIFWLLWVFGGGLLIGVIREVILLTIRTVRGRKYHERSAEIINKYKDILDGKYETLSIGGANVLKQTGIPKESLSILFNAVEGENTLVNLALKGQIAVENIVLSTLPYEETASSRHVVFIDVINKTDQPIEFAIPKGQVVENKELESKTQNLAIANDYQKINLEAQQKARIRLGAHCMNKEKPAPQNVFGNLTVFVLRDADFVSQEQLWDIVEDAKKEMLVK